MSSNSSCSDGDDAVQAYIRVLGKNGSTQMLKVWLPGLMQLVGDHTKIAIPDQDIAHSSFFYGADDDDDGVQANIRVLGKNGSTQMLKVWLPGLMQLVGDHTKIAIADQDITTLLDADSGLRIQTDA